MKVLSLRPYHGDIWLCESLQELRKAYRKLIRKAYPYDDDDPEGGRYVKIVGDGVGATTWLIFAATPHALAHEFAHVLLQTFDLIGHDPRVGDGEPFCYMLSQLLLEAVDG